MGKEAPPLDSEWKWKVPLELSVLDASCLEELFET